LAEELERERGVEQEVPLAPRAAVLGIVRYCCKTEAASGFVDAGGTAVEVLGELGLGQEAEAEGGLGAELPNDANFDTAGLGLEADAETMGGYKSCDGA
jgi:hypothetical protein